MSEYSPNETYIDFPSADLTAAAHGLEAAPNPTDISDKEAFNIAWSALEKFCYADVLDYTKPQTEMMKYYILTDVAVPPELLAEQYASIYSTAIQGLCKILYRDRCLVEPQQDTLLVFTNALCQEIQGTPDSIVDMLFDETKNTLKNGDFITRSVATYITRERMWQIITALPGLSKYQEHMNSPSMHQTPSSERVWTDLGVAD